MFNVKDFHIYLLFIFLIFSLHISGQEPAVERPKIGLVLSGGGAKGFAHVGVLKVLEEAGIRPDFITGTSMGSIVGGLYSIGYSADSLEKIAKTSDWSYLLSDEISRRNLALEEKKDNDRFIVSFPIKENKIKIPSGVVNGQNVENMLNKLCAPVYNINDFNDFQIPFTCIATDIETGDEVIFREGNLPRILRASMSIPSIFNPIEIDDKLLVDGGVVNNFPVLRAREMGADIIIGVDVGFQYYKKDQLNSMFRIIEQSIFFYGEELNVRNKEAVDYLIEPDLQGFNASSFNSVDTIIAIGYKSAKQYLPQLKKLADNLRRFESDYKPDQQLPEVDSFKLMEIRIRGIEKVSGKFLTGKLQLEMYSNVSPSDIEEAIKRLYSSLYFEKVSYKIEPLEKGIRLLVDVKEARGGQFRLGLHYDTNFKSALLFNITFRNLILDGSKLSGSLSLGENPYFRAEYFKNNGWKPGFGLEFETSRFNVYAYEKGTKISSMTYFESSTRIFTQSIIRNSYALGGGIQFEAARVKPRINPVDEIDTRTLSYMNYYGFLNMDTYDNAFYPKQGMKLNAEVKLITHKETDPVGFAKIQFSNANRISRRLTLLTNLNAGAVDGSTIPYQYYFYTGGIYNVQRNGLIPFVGMDYMERSSLNALVLGGDLQMEVFPDIYLLLRGNIGNLRDDFRELLTTHHLVGGYAITAGYDSWIGPIELSLTKSARQPGILAYLNIGFWF